MVKSVQIKTSKTCLIIYYIIIIFFNLNQYNRFAALFDGERQIAVLLS